MRLQVILALTLTVSTVAGAPRPKETKEPKLEGTWRQVHAEFNGQDMTAAERPTRNHWVITADRITIYTVGGANRGHWTYRLDPAKRPAEIDLTTRAGGQEVTYPCIYKLEGDRLTVCIQNFPDRGRPTRFETAPDSGVGMYVYVRARPGDEKGVDPAPAPPARGRD